MGEKLCANDFPDGEENEDLDPRIQLELDVLNKASTDINVLEKCLEEERRNYDQIFAEVSQKLNFLQGKLKSAIDKSRAYCDLLEKFKTAHAATQTAAKRYERAISSHQAAQQMVSVAEVGFQNSARAASNLTVNEISSFEYSNSNDGNVESRPKASNKNSTALGECSGGGSFDLAWQEMLNVAVAKVNQAERELTASEAEHQAKMLSVTEIEGQLKKLQKQSKGSIKKSKPYYEAKSLSNLQFEDQLRRIKHIESKISENKQKYATALRNLEAISEEIHFRRESSLGPRGQGVGAEHVDDDVDLGTHHSEDPISLQSSPMSRIRQDPIGADSQVFQRTPIISPNHRQYSQLTPEDAKSLALGQSSVDQYLDKCSTISLAEQLENNLKMDPHGVSQSERDVNMCELETLSFVDDSESVSSTFSTPKKLVYDVKRAESTFSRTFNLPNTATSVGLKKVNLRISRSVSDETLYRSACKLFP